MHENVFRNQLKKKLEKIGGLVIRINDVPGTGIRYADLIWIYGGKVYGIECKVNRSDKPETIKNHKQGKYATGGQLIANNLFQKVGALFIYAVYFVNEKETLFAFYEDDKNIYTVIEAKELKPKYVTNFDTFKNIVMKCFKTAESPLEYFKEAMKNERL